MSSLPLALLVLLLLASCQPPPDERQFVAEASEAAGRAVVQRVGCGACHTFPDIAWPRGQLGPDLGGFAEQTLIAGRFPNRPDVLVAFVRNAPELAPGTTMPAMPISEREARDVAAYLYTLDDR